MLSNSFKLVLLIIFLNSCMSLIYTPKVNFNKAGMSEKFYMIEDSEYRVWEGGYGNKNILLIHGIGGDAQLLWNNQVIDFKDEYKLFAPDLLYFGKSNSLTKNYSLEYQGDMLYKLIKKLNIKDLHVIAISYGGLVVWDIIKKYPDIFNKVVIIDCPLDLFEYDDYLSIKSNLGVNTLSEVLVPQNSKDVETLLEISYKNPPPYPQFILDYIFSEHFSHNVTDKKALLNHLEKYEMVNNSISLIDYSIPQMLMIWGEDDPIFSSDYIKKIRNIYGANIKSIVIENAQHTPNLEYPKIVNDEILEFLKL